MDKIEEINKLYNQEGKSLREIVDITGHAFETVQKYAYMKDFNIEIPIIQTREGKLDPFNRKNSPYACIGSSEAVRSAAS